MRCPQCQSLMTKVQSVWVCGNLSAHPEPIILPIEANILPVLYNELPTPIALLVTEYEQERHPFIKLHRMIDASEMVLRFLFVVAVSDLHRQLGSFPSVLKEQFASRLYRPTFGDWSDMLSSSLRHFFRNKLDCLISELPMVWDQIWKPLIGNNNGSPDHEILPLRNNIAHAGRLTDDAAEMMLAMHAEHFEKAINELFFFSKYQVIAVNSVGEQYLLQGVPTQNDWTFPKLIPQTSNPTNSGVYVNYAGEYLLLSPLHVYLPLRQLNGSKYDLNGFEQNDVPMLYLRYNNFRDCLEYTALARQAHFAQYADDLKVSFFQMFNLPTWENEKLEKKASQALGNEIVRHGYHFEDLVHRFPEMSMIVGRHSQFADVQKWIQEHAQDGGELWIGGKPGVGKSAFMMGLIKRLVNDKKITPIYLIPFFFRSGDARCNLEAFFHSAVLHIKQFFSIQLNINLNESFQEQFFQIFDVLNSQLTNADQVPKLIFLLDGIDELGSSAAELGKILATVASPRCIWVLAGRGNTPINKDMDVLWGTGELAPLSNSDIRTLLEQELGLMRYDLYRRDEVTNTIDIQNPFVETLIRRSEGLPLYIQLVVEDIRIGNLSILDEVKLPQGLQDYYQKMIERMAVGDVSQIMTDVIALLSWTMEPISEKTMAEILSPTYPHRCEELLDTALHYGHVMVQRIQTGNQNVGWSLYHDSFRQYLQKTDFIKNARSRVHELLLSWCGEWNDHKNPYALRYYAQHLADAKKHETLFELARNENFYSTCSQLFMSNPVVHFNPLRYAIRAAFQSKLASEFVEFMLKHAVRINDLLIGESPLRALRTENLVRARQLANLTNPEVNWHWHLILAGELYIKGHTINAKEELAELSVLSSVKLTFLEKSTCKILSVLAPIITTPILLILPDILSNDGMKELCDDLLKQGYPSLVEQLFDEIPDCYWKKRLLKDVYYSWQMLGDKKAEASALERWWKDESQNIRYIDNNLLWMYTVRWSTNNNIDSLDSFISDIETELINRNATYSKFDQLVFYQRLSAVFEKHDDIELAYHMIQKVILISHLVSIESDKAPYLRMVVEMLIRMGHLSEAILLTERISLPLERTLALNALSEALWESGERRSAIKKLEEALISGQTIGDYVKKVEVLCSTTLLVSRFDTPDNAKKAFALAKTAADYAISRTHEDYTKNSIIESIDNLFVQIPFLGKTDAQRIIEDKNNQDIQQIEKAIQAILPRYYSDTVSRKIIAHLLTAGRYQDALHLAMRSESGLVLSCVDKLISSGDLDLAMRTLVVVGKKPSFGIGKFLLAYRWEKVGQLAIAKRLLDEAIERSITRSTYPEELILGIKEIALRELNIGEPIIARRFVSLYDERYKGFGQEGLVIAYLRVNEFDEALQTALDISRIQNRDHALERIAEAHLKLMQIGRCLEILQKMQNKYRINLVCRQLLKKAQEINDILLAKNIFPFVKYAHDPNAYDAVDELDDFIVFYLELNLWDEAMQLFELALKPNPVDQIRNDVLKALLEISSNAAELGNQQSARLILNDYRMAKHNVDLDILQKEIEVLIKLDDFDQVQAYCKQYENPDIQLSVAKKQGALGQWSASRSTVTNLIQSIDSERETNLAILVHSWYYLGVIYKHLGLSHEAEDAFRKAQKIALQTISDFFGSKAASALIVDLVEQKQFDQALELAHQIGNFEGDKFQAYLKIADGQIAHDDNFNANNTLQLAFDNTPLSTKVDYIPGDKAEAYIKIARLYLKMGDRIRVRHLLSDAEKNAELDPWIGDNILTAIAVVFSETGDYSNAFRINSKLKDTSKRNRAYSSVGATLIKAGFTDEALQLIIKMTNHREELLLDISDALVKNMDFDNFGALLVLLAGRPETAIVACVQLAKLLPEIDVEISHALLKQVI